MSSILTITLALDEELHIGRCVQSALPLGPVFVVDCGSTDQTVEIAREAGATVVFHPWEGHARQKNWAIDHVPVDCTWLLFVDADDHVSHGVAGRIAEDAAR